MSEDVIKQAVNLGRTNVLELITISINCLPCVNDLISRKAVRKVLEKLEKAYETEVGDNNE